MCRLIKALCLAVLFNAGFVQSLKEIIAIAPNEERKSHYAINQPFTRHAKEITNESEIFDVDFGPFGIIANSVDNLDADDVRAAILSTLKDDDVRAAIISTLESNLNRQKSEFTYIQNVAIFGEILINSEDEETKIDVQGGKVTFEDLFLNKVSEVELNKAVSKVLVQYLNENDLFSGVEVTLYVPSPQPSITPVKVSGSEVIESEEFIANPNGTNAGAIAIGVIGAVCATIAAAFFVKKRYGIEVTHFGRNYDTDRQEVPLSPTSMKRDLDFEQFVVECCVDNDTFDNDQQFMSMQHKQPAQFNPGENIV